MTTSFFLRSGLMILLGWALVQGAARGQNELSENNENDLELFGGNNTAFGENPFNNGEYFNNFNSMNSGANGNSFGLENNSELFLNETQNPSTNLYLDPLQSETYGPGDGEVLQPEFAGQEPEPTPFAEPSNFENFSAEEPIDYFADPVTAPVADPAADPLQTEGAFEDPLASVPSGTLDPFAAPFETDPIVPAEPEVDPLAGIGPEGINTSPETVPGSDTQAFPATPDEITIGTVPSEQLVPEEPMVNGMKLSELNTLRKVIAELKPKSRGSFPDEYIVQPGDTLWDISDQLLDDPFWWPKLWSYNPGIINPHLLTPGMRIVFEASDGVLPPGVSLSDNGDFLPVAVSDKDLGIVRHPLVEAWRDLDGTIVNPDEIPISDQFDIYGELKVSASKYISIPGFLSGNTPRAYAVVASLNTHRWAAAKGDVVYTEPSQGWTPEAGERFLVVREQSLAEGATAVRHSMDFWVYSGVVGVVGRERTGRIRLIVEESAEGVRPGDRIVPFRELLKPVLTQSDREPREMPAVIAAIGNGEQTLASLLDVVHLVGGISDLREGDIVPIFTHPSGVLFPDEKLEFIQAGSARIIHVEERTAVGVVIRVEKEISLGSQTLAGLALAQ